jgi:hypothetical protein
MGGSEKITEAEIRAFLARWFKMAAEKRPLAEQQQMFAPGCRIRGAGHVLTIADQIALHAGFSRETRNILDLDDREQRGRRRRAGRGLFRGPSDQVERRRAEGHSGQHDRKLADRPCADRGRAAIRQVRDQQPSLPAGLGEAFRMIAQRAD